jgi:hypothetical protein
VKVKTSSSTPDLAKRRHIPERMPEAEAYEMAIHILVNWIALEVRVEEGCGREVVDLLSMRSGVRSEVVRVLGSPRCVGRSPGRGGDSRGGDS